jgi:hypothetical protein
VVHRLEYGGQVAAVITQSVHQMQQRWGGWWCGTSNSLSGSALVYAAGGGGGGYLRLVGLAVRQELVALAAERLAR